MTKKNRRSHELRVGLILNYVSTAVGLIASLLFNPIIIRNLGQSEYGLYETIGSFVNYLAVLDFGFSAVVVRYTAKYESLGETKRRDEFLYTARRIYQCLAGVVVLGGLVLYSLLDVIFGSTFSPAEMEKAHYLFLFVLGTTALSIYGQVYAGALSGVERFIVPRVIRLAKIIFGKVVCILVILLGADSIGYTAVLFVFEGVGCVANCIYAQKIVSFSKCKANFAEIKELLVFTGFLFIQAIASQLYWTIDKLVLGAMLGTATVAIYSVAMNLHNIVENISTSIRDVLLPKATRFAVSENGIKYIQQFMTKAGRLILIVFGLLFAGLLVLGKEFLFLWLGPEYLEAYSIFIVLGATSLLPSILTIGETVCRAFNKHQFLSYANLVAAIINVGMTILFVRWWGMHGAAFATGVGLILVYTILRLIYYKKTFGLGIRRFFKDVFSGIVPALILTVVIGYGSCIILKNYSWLTLVIQAFIMTGVFGLAMFLFGFSSEEKKTAQNMIVKIKANLFLSKR